jgi:hypothetical protein
MCAVLSDSSSCKNRGARLSSMVNVKSIVSLKIVEVKVVLGIELNWPGIIRSHKTGLSYCIESWYYTYYSRLH